ncbi:MAG: biotin carboxylase N-terminal domain-containing protein [Sandaracinaceae bacterium]
MIERILIANRGEVAVRIARSCRRLGVEPVGVHVDADASCPHIDACDRTVRIGAEHTAYRDPVALVAAAREAEVHAVHPGYGLLAAEAAFAQAVEEQGLIFVGPASERFEVCRDRLAVQEVAREAGVRLLVGSLRPILEPGDALADVDRVGYPVSPQGVLGLGEPTLLHRADDVADLSDALDALGELEAVGGGLLTRYVERARHVEVQVAYDGRHAHVLGDRECSLRKDGRKLLCEAPAPAIDQLYTAEAVRGALWDASVEVTQRIGVRGLAACHFVIDPDGVFFFTGFTPGLQVEHATTEMTTALDLVELQLTLAAGEALSDEVLRTEPSGAALQARIDAALDPRSSGPLPGRVEAARWPPAPQGRVRIEAGVRVGSVVDPSHEALVATVTTFAAGRHDALLTLDRILAETHLSPLVTNLRLLRKALNHESFRAGQYDADFVQRI